MKKKKGKPNQGLLILGLTNQTLHVFTSKLRARPVCGSKSKAENYSSPPDHSLKLQYQKKQNQAEAGKMLLNFK